MHLRAAGTRNTTSLQASCAPRRNRRILWYQGVVSVRKPQRQSATSGRSTNTGLPMAPAKWATEESMLITTSSSCSTRAVSKKSVQDPMLSGSQAGCSRASFCRPDPGQPRLLKQGLGRGHRQRAYTVVGVAGAALQDDAHHCDWAPCRRRCVGQGTVCPGPQRHPAALGSIRA